MMTPEDATREWVNEAGRARFKREFKVEPEAWLRRMIEGGKQTPSEAKRNLKRVLDRLASVELEFQMPPRPGAALIQ